jgi:hypothetical protein
MRGAGYLYSFKTLIFRALKHHIYLFRQKILQFTMSSPKPIQLTFHLVRSSSLSFDGFRERYKKHMADACPILKQYNCFKYSVQLNSIETQNVAMSAMGIAKASPPTYDAVTTLSFPSLEDFKGFMGDGEHHNLLKRDGDMCDNAKTVILCGEVVDGI